MKIFTIKLNSRRPWSLKVRDFSGVQNSWKSPNKSFALFHTQKYFGYLEFEI